MELFERSGKEGRKINAPLADRMRPRSLEEIVGQRHLIGENGFLTKLLKKKEMPSLILWGPPGSGKTTLASAIATEVGAKVISFSAVLSGVKQIREVIGEAQFQLSNYGRKTILFVDEIHRFNKVQQDAFLHHVEDGTLTLIGATTENPSFEINAPLLSRCRVLVLDRLTEEDIKTILKRALSDVERGFGRLGVSIDNKALEIIARYAQGDARNAMNLIETATALEKATSTDRTVISIDTVKEALQKKVLVYDKDGEEHYNLISAFIKAMRGSDPDAAIYWLARMLEAGEDPLFIVRRMVVFASEDIGNADPAALGLALSIKGGVELLGMPEGWIPLAQGVTYLATAPKSNASYMAYKKALSDVKERGALPVPLHIRNAPTGLMKELGYGRGYRYPHNFEEGVVEQDYLPDEIRGHSYYEPTTRGYEAGIAKMLKNIKTRKTKG